MSDRFGTDSVRLGILRHVVSLYEAATDDIDPQTGETYYGISFSTVELGPLGDPDARRRNAIGVVVGAERKTHEFPLQMAELEINIEFRVTMNAGDDRPAIMAERILGVVQQIVYDDDTFGGKIIKFDEAGNEVDLVTYMDRTVQGVLNLVILYRHRSDNVYDPDPSA